MPHLVMDCSESVVELAPPRQLLEAVQRAAESSGLFAREGVGGIKVRLRTFAHYRNPDDREHFVHVFAYIMQGRSEEQRRDLARRVTAALDELLPQVEIISVNVAEFERATYFNKLKLQAEAGLPSEQG